MPSRLSGSPGQRVARGTCRMPCWLGVLALGLLLTGCALPPPPGALFEWSVVGPIDIAPERPLVATQVQWQDFLLGAAPVADGCGLDTCLADQQAWVERCVKARAAPAARTALARLMMPGAKGLQGLSMRAPVASAAGGACAAKVTAAPVSPACGPSWRSTAAATGVVQAMVVQATAATAEAPDCGAVRRATLGVEVLELDRARQSLGDFMVHDMPAIFGSTLGAMASLGTVTAMSDLVHRVVVLTLTIEHDGAAPARISARGAAGVRVGSLKMIEPTTPPPPELVGVAFVEALRKLDAALSVYTARRCAAAAR